MDKIQNQHIEQEITRSWDFSVLLSLSNSGQRCSYQNTETKIIIAKYISARKLIMQAGWDFRFCIYVCMYVCMYVMLQECWLRCNAHALLLRLAQSRTMLLHDRQSQTSELQYKIRGCRRLPCREVNDEHTTANSTFLVKHIVLSLLAFSQRGAWSRLHGLVWDPSIAAACRVVLILIIAGIFNDCCTLYEWWLPMIVLQK